MFIHTAPMSMEEIRRVAPAVFGKYPAAGRTDRYRMIDSAGVIERLGAHDYLPMDAGQDKPTRRDPMTVRHMVRFVHKDNFDRQAVQGETVPQILFWNSHNGRTKARLTLGMYRFVCANGMVCGTDTAVIAVPHSMEAANKAIIDGITTIDEEQKKQIACIDGWDKKELTDTAMHAFAEKALELRFGANSVNYSSTDALQAIRSEDEGRTLWKVLNRVQENLTTRPLSGVNGNGRSVVSRPINGIESDLRVNRALWDLAAAVAA